MKIRDGLVQLFRREVGEQLRKRTETDGGLIEILVRLRLLKADRPVHIIVYAPVFVSIPGVGRTVLRPDEGHDAARIAGLGAQKIRYRRNVFRKRLYIAKGVVIDFLQNIPASGVGHNEKCNVHMPAAVVFAGDRRSVQLKDAQNIYLILIHGKCSLCSVPVYFSQSDGR